MKVRIFYFLFSELRTLLADCETNRLAPDETPLIVFGFGTLSRGRVFAPGPVTKALPRIPNNPEDTSGHLDNAPLARRMATRGSYAGVTPQVLAATLAELAELRAMVMQLMEKETRCAQGEGGARGSTRPPERALAATGTMGTPTQAP